jgi:competence protein ComEC
LALLPTPWTAVWLPGLADALLWPLRFMVQSPRGLWPMWWADGPRAWLIGLAAPVVLAGVWHGGRWRLRAGLAIAAVALACGWHAWANRVAPGTVRVAFLDVGHGDCTALEFADGSTALVDAGGFVGDDGLVGRLAVVPWLRKAGFSRIDRMVLSHAHPDHENGLVAVARRFDVGELWWNGQPAQGQEHKALLAALTTQGTQWRSFAPQDGGPRLISIGGVQIRVLSPQPLRAPFARDLGLNDNSLVLEVTTGAHRMLLAGDIERTTEAALVEARLLRPVDVLKVPHHGSRTSSTPAFLAAVQPGLAVAGARPWGALPFPHADVIARYGKAGVPLWSTAGGMVALTMAPEGVSAQQGARSWAIGP